MSHVFASPTHSKTGNVWETQRKLENHAAAVALNYFAYNFIKIHRTLLMTPAMAAGVTDRCWTLRTWLPSGSHTSSGGRKERRKNGACDTKARPNKCKMNGQMSVEAVSS